MSAWIKKNMAGVAIASFLVATTGIASLVKVVRLASDLGNMTLALLPLMLVVGIAVLASLVGLTAVGVITLSGRAHAGSPTVGAPH